MNPLGKIANLLGLNIRYLLCRMLGKNISKRELVGKEGNSLDKADYYFANSLIGMVVIAMLLIVLFYYFN